MAHRRLMLQICLIVEDLPDDAREELARDLVLDDLDESEELPRLAHYEHADEFGYLVADFIGEPEICWEMFAGSDIFARFHSAQLINAEWHGEILDGAPVTDTGPVPIKPQEA